MEIITTPHSLRPITLRYNREVTAPAFETLTLAYYQEIHDRTFEIKQRVRQARKKIPEFNFSIEDLEVLYKEAVEKFEHLIVMYPENPLKPLVREQLKALVRGISVSMDGFVPEMIEEATQFFSYDNYIFEHEQWMDNVAFPQFSEIFSRYKECSVDLAFFDRDLEDFKYSLSCVKEEERKYIDEMNELVESYSDLNYEIEQLFDRISAFDKTLLGDLI